MGWKRRILFGLAYLTGNTPWDTGVTPPEVIRLVQSGELMPGRAVDLGCGTGLNAIYLVRHGWEVTGVDGAAAAIRRARGGGSRGGGGGRRGLRVGKGGGCGGAGGTGGS